MNQAKTNYNIPTNRPDVIQLIHSGAYYEQSSTDSISVFFFFLIRNHTEFPVKFGVSELEHEWGGRLDLGNGCEKPNKLTNRSRIWMISQQLNDTRIFLFVCFMESIDDCVINLKQQII